MMAQTVGGSLLDGVQRALTARYRDLTNPWYGWVKPAYEAMPYAAVVADLVALGATVEDDTDLNNDVSCRYFVRRGDTLLIAELSLVGPYAVVMDGRDEASGLFTLDVPTPELAQALLVVLKSHGLHVLDAKMLQTPVAMPFQNVGAGQGTFYQALISDTPGPEIVDAPQRT